MSEIEKLAKELQEYTIFLGSHNKHIQNVANRLVELTDRPQLNENQQIVLKSLKNKYVGHPIETIFMLHDELVKNSKINVVEAYKKLSGKEEMQILQVFIQWVLEQEEHNERS